MKIIDAVWEKRNLGVDTVEIVLDKDDSLDLLDKEIKLCGAQYQVVKAPALRLDFYKMLVENGFVFIETICRLRNMLKPGNSDFITERLKSQMSCSIMNQQQMDILYDELKSGMFGTDRISIDPKFSVDIANGRYKGWIEDSIKSGATAIDISYKGNSAGFILYKLDGNRVDAYLGGVYQKYINCGMGVAVNGKGLDFIMEQGGKEMYTSVSTNNLPALKANLAIGYEICDIEYVFIKHNDL